MKTFIHITEIIPNPDHVRIHLRTKVTDGKFIGGIGSSHNKGEYPLLDELEEIEGVAELFMKNYEIGVTKAVAFKWSEILPKVLATIFKRTTDIPDNVPVILPSYVKPFSFICKYERYTGEFIDDVKVITQKDHYGDY